MRSISSLFLVSTTTLAVVFSLTTSNAFAEDNTNTYKQIDATKCRDLGFASPQSSSPPVCGTCDVLADLLKATAEEKQLSDEVRLSNKNMKKQLMAECRSCCVPGSFEDDADSRHAPQQLASSSSSSSGFVSVTIEVDKSVAENTATPINRFIRLHSTTWDSEKISLQFTELMAPRLHLKRTNGKVDIVNVGSWEPELIWEYLRKGLIA